MEQHQYSNFKNKNIGYAKVGRRVFSSLYDAETYCTEQGLDVNSDIEYREDVALKHEIQEIARYQKAILRECISRLNNRKDNLSSEIDLLNKQLEHCNPLDEDCIKYRRDEAISKLAGTYSAIDIVHGMLIDLENLSEWHD